MRSGSAAPVRIASAASRSVMLSAAAKRRDDAVDRRPVAVADNEVERGVGERTAAGGRGVGAKTAALRRCASTSAASRSPMRSAMARAEAVAGRGDGVGIDVAADLAGDVGFAREVAAPGRGRPAPARRSRRPRRARR